MNYQRFKSLILTKPAEHRVAQAPPKSFRFNLAELGGALGDLGTLLPLVVALITLNQMSATSVLLIVGLGYIIAGLFYRLPVPVQPLKAVAAIAIAGGLSASLVSASGLLMGVFLLLLVATRTIGLVAKLFPKAIIRGIQLGVGLLLVKAGLVLVNKQQVIIGGSGESLSLASVAVPLSWLLALVLGGVFILLLRRQKLPASLLLLILGVFVGIFWGSLLGLPSLRFGLSLPALAIPSLKDLSAALVLLVIPQIPLTLGNAVFATVDTAQSYFGARAKKVTPKALLTTMGLTNLGAGLLGGMPICHGSGGLTAHFRLGARTGAAGLMIGVPFLALALFLDGNVLPILSLIPYSVLGVLVVFVGAQHALLARDIRGKDEILVALTVGIVGVATANLAIGLASGIVLRLIVSAPWRSRAMWSRLLMARRKARLVDGRPEKPTPVS